MKVLWINDEANFTGGAERYIFDTASKLLSDFNVTSELIYSIDSKIDKEFCNVFSFVQPNSVKLEEQLELINPNIIYFNSVSSNKTLEIISKSRFKKIAFIHDHKDFCLREHKYTTINNKTCTKTIGLNCYACLGFIQKSETFPFKIKTLSDIKKNQKLLKLFDKIIVASDYMKNHLESHGFKKEKVLKINLDSRKINLGNKKEINNILFVGQLVKGKGIDTLLLALSISQNKYLNLDICGDGNLKEYLISRTIELKISDRVKFHGKVSNEKLSEFYERTMFVVIPSIAPETFNLVGLEAMKHGKAVIASDVGGIQEWLEPGINGELFKSKDYIKLSHYIDFFSYNSKLRKDFGKNGLNKFNEKFSDGTHTKKLYNTLEGLYE